MTNWLQTLLFHSYPLITAICAMGTAQCIKITLSLYRKKPFSIKLLCASGGMPSSHSALMAGLSTSIGIHDGWMSSTYYICIVISLIILYDAAGVRRAVGDHARTLKKIIESPSHQRSGDSPSVTELIGHTPFEVIIGTAIGISTAIVLY